VRSGIRATIRFVAGSILKTVASMLVPRADSTRWAETQTEPAPSTTRIGVSGSPIRATRLFVLGSLRFWAGSSESLGTRPATRR
jgi:hypothetical protein